MEEKEAGQCVSYVLGTSNQKGIQKVGFLVSAVDDWICDTEMQNPNSERWLLDNSILKFKYR